MARRVEFLKDSLTPNLKRFDAQVQRGVNQVLFFHEPRLRSHARKAAPWEDDTGNARNGLSTEVGELSPGRHYLKLFHRVPYGIWLEIIQQGKYSIIMPSINLFGPQVMASLTKLVKRFKEAHK